MPRQTFISKFPLFILLCFATSSVKAGRTVRRAQDTAECQTIKECDNLWKHGEAYECSEGKCKCHPHATLDQAVCKCNQGYTKRGNECVSPALEPNARASSECVFNENCKENFVCVNNKCECDNDYVLFGEKCYIAAKNINDSCVYDVQCTTKLGGHSSCENTRCVCKTDAVSVEGNKKCLLKKGLGETCSYSEQCFHIQHSICSTDVCLCDPNFVPFNQTCEPVVDYYNASCNTSLQCSEGKLGYGSTCDKVTHKCVCEVEYFYKQDKGVCMFSKGLGKECNDKDIGCYLPQDGYNQNIECKKGKCTCKKKYVPSEDNQHCESSGVGFRASLTLLAFSLVLCAGRW